MKIVIKTPKILAQESLLAFVRDKVQKLSIFSGEIHEAQITLRLRNTEEPENKTCEIKGVISGNDLYAEKHAATFEEAAMKAVDAMKKQISNWKGKALSNPGSLS